jgi:aspartate kinase
MKKRLQKQTIIVQKYGGATLSNPEKIKKVAQRIVLEQKKGLQIVAVVSAMGETTNQLISLAHQISVKPPRRELDMLLSTGERVSMALLSMAITDLKKKAISFTGSQAGIMTDESHVSAFIREVHAYRVDSALSEGKIVVLAGFQGVSPLTKEITTLGRGGSDTTAVAMAAYLGADRCEILKDVPGVFTADPKIVAQARNIPQLNYDQMLEMTFWGAKVLHYRSVELAKLKNVKLYIGPAQNAGTQNTKGTFVENKKSSGGHKMYESSAVIAINSQSEVLKISANEKTASTFLRKLESALDKNEIPSPQLLFLQPSTKGQTAFFTGPQETLESVKVLIKNQSLFKLSRDSWASVSATCSGATDSKTIQQVVEKLEKNKIPVEGFFQSAMSSVVIVPRSLREKTIQALHQLIEVK